MSLTSLIALILFGLLAAGIVAIIVPNVLRENLDAQERFITQLKDCNETHPGLYDAEIEREVATLERMKTRRSFNLKSRDRKLK